MYHTYNNRKNIVIEIGLTDLLTPGWKIVHSDNLSPAFLDKSYRRGKFDTSKLHLRFKHGWKTPKLSNSTQESLPFQKENEPISTLLPLLLNSFYHLGSLAHQKIGHLLNGFLKEMRNPFKANFTKITWTV